MEALGLSSNHHCLLLSLFHAWSTWMWQLILHLTIMFSFRFTQHIQGPLHWRCKFSLSKCFSQTVCGRRVTACNSGGFWRELLVCHQTTIACYILCLMHGLLECNNCNDHSWNSRIGDFLYVLLRISRSAYKSNCQSRAGVLNLLVLAYLQAKIEPLCVPSNHNCSPICLPKSSTFEFLKFLHTPSELLAYAQGYSHPRLRTAGLEHTICPKLEACV